MSFIIDINIGIGESKDIIFFSNFMIYKYCNYFIEEFI